MHRLLFRIRQRGKVKGQGLVEYALILVLVSIVVIAILTIFGKSLSNTYCSIVVNLKQGTGASKACKNPVVTLAVNSLSGGQLNMEAVVIDPDKPSSMTLSDAIDVSFYKNGAFVRTETDERFCLGSGSTPPSSPPCTNSIAVVSGDVIRAVATDVDGNSTEATYTVP